MPDDQEPLTLADSIRRKIAESQDGMGAPPLPSPSPKTSSLQIHLEFSEAKVDSLGQKARVIAQQVSKEKDLKVGDGGRYDSTNLRIRELVDKAAGPLTVTDRGLLLERVRDEVFGFGPLGPLLKDPTVNQIFVNGVSQIYVEHHGIKEKVQVTFEDEAHLLETIEKILGPLNLRLDENNPMVSARMPNGAPVEICGPPLSIDGPTILINCTASSPFSLGQMIEAGMLTPELADVLRNHVKNRSNIVVSGFGDAGQNALVNALSAHIAPQERVISIETTASLRLMQEHWIRFEAGSAHADRPIAMKLLVQKALRMCPDRLVVGDCSGAEAFDIFEACAYGSTRGITVVRATSVSDCIRRLEKMISEGDAKMPREQVLELLNDGVQIIVHMARTADGKRRVTEVSEITKTGE